MNYMKFWFWLDMIATLPYEDMIVVPEGDDSIVKVLRFLKFFRLFR